MSKKNTGKLREKVVTILERHLDQSARVSFDQQLPVLKSPKRKRQVDVLIETGRPTRRTISIVETQDRVNKPKQHEFDAWLVKMREVGAQHLICVTSAGYPQSIIDKAKEEGPTVRLYTLRQLEKCRGDILPPTMIMNSTMQLVEFGKLHQVQTKMEGGRLRRIHPDLQSGELDPTYKMFWPNGHDQPVSPLEVADWHFFGSPKNIEELPHDGTMVTVEMRHGNNFKYKIADGWAEVDWLRIVIDISVTNCPIVWEESRYEEVGGEEVGWIVKGTSNVNGRLKQLYVPFRAEGNGLYTAGRAVSLSDDDTFFMAIGDRGHRGESFRPEPSLSQSKDTLRDAIRRTIGDRSKR